MGTVEIRFQNKFLIPMLVFFGLVIIAVSGYVFFSEEYAGKTVYKILQAVFDVGLFYYVYNHYSKLKKKGPVLLLTPDTLVIYDKTSIDKTFLWKEIQELKIEDKGEGLCLKVKSAADNAKTNLTWLDKTPKEIEELIAVYRKAATLTV